MKLKEMIQKHILFFLLLMLAAGVLFVFSCATSPLYPNFYGTDSAFFRFIGRSILKGKTPYKDIWDNKGPLLFFVQALGALRGTRNTPGNLLFLLQLCSLSLAALFMAGINHIAGPANRRSFLIIFAAVCTLSVFSKTLHSGNLTEEWSLSFICFSLYLMIKYAVNTKSSASHPGTYAFWHGICFASLAFIRISNAVTVCGGLVIIGTYLIIKRQWKNLFSNIVFGISGVLLIVVPVCIYFYWKDALADMIYAVFLYNLKYAGEKTHGTFSCGELVLRYLPVAAAAIIFVIHMIRKRYLCFLDILIMGIITANTVLLLKTNLYMHYFTIFLPVFLTVLLICLKDLSCIPEIILAGIVLFFFVVQNSKMVPELKYRKMSGPRFITAENIPCDERRSAIAINVLPEIYLYTGIEPCSRFAAYQNIHFSIEPKFAEEFIETLQTVQPIWIIIPGFENNGIPELQSILENGYHFEFSDPSAYYFRQNW